jgi:hypothetical protein
MKIDSWLHFMPLLIAPVFSVLMIIGRILTNRFVKNRHTQAAKEWFLKMKSPTASDDEKQKFENEYMDTFIKNPPAGQIPIICSMLYLIGFLGLIAMFFWAFVSISWWASVIIVALYLLAGFVPSLLKP